MRVDIGMKRTWLHDLCSPDGRTLWAVGSLGLIMIDLFSYEAVFLLASGLIFCGAWMISKVNEPRLREGNP
ncbi:hypothetical protein J7M22_16875 [Candidatus Poribacteria bacterium]|nr:hypothetical protein [Candidatus Poribacteria bacterium]